jgi:hypothetical protein
LPAGVGVFEAGLASALQGVKELVCVLVARCCSEHQAQRFLAVPPNRQSRLEVRHLDGAGAVGEGVHDAQAQELGLGSGREGTGHPVDVVVDVVVDDLPQALGG